MNNSKKVTVAATQMACSWDIESNIQQAETLIREAAAKGAEVILIQELYETPYFCIEQEFKHLKLASTLEESVAIKQMCALAKELSVVLPISWFERSGLAFFNSVAMIDADGSVMGTYRKTHLPNAIGYQEKQYFSPGDTGFKVWDTRYAKIGVGISGFPRRRGVWHCKVPKCCFILPPLAASPGTQMRIQCLTGRM